MPTLAGTAVRCAGPLEAEERLLEAAEQDQRERRADLAGLARPFGVLVPSESLRQHLVERLATRCGAVLGLRVLTLPAFARELHERAGKPWPGGEPLLAILARRALAAHAELSVLARGADGLEALLSALRDLQHAGFSRALLEPALECLSGAPLGDDPALQRARALLALAAGLEAELAAAGTAPAGAWALSCAELLRAQPALPGMRTLWIHGFVDAPGTTAELLQTLVERAGARWNYDALALSLAPGPTGTHFGAGLAERLGFAPGATRTELVPAGTRLGFVRASGSRAEARAVATALSARLAAGARPERIAIVARNLTGLSEALAGALRTLGVPFSGLGAQGSLTARERALHALADLLEEGPRTRLVRVLRAGWSLPMPPGLQPFELVAACALLGATRLEPLVALDLDRALGVGDRVRLPGTRRRARAVEPEGEADEGAGEAGDVGEAADESEPAGARHEVPRARLEEFQRGLARWLAELAGLPARAPAARFAEPLGAALAVHVPALRAEVAAALEQLAADLPAGFVLARAEFLELFAAALRSAARAPLGGAGGGVQVLDALEARGRSFDELFLVDLQQGSFPRSVREEPLLPDRLRLRLLPVLPDLPVKGAGLAEEQALFAGLLAAAPRLQLSWPCNDADGRRLAPSPFLCRAWRESGGDDRGPERAALASFAPASSSRTERFALALGEREALVAAALRGPAALRAALPEVLEAHGRTAAKAATLARARGEALEELEPARARAAYPNAFLGSVGPLQHAGDPRRAPLWISSLEALASCPWQMLLGRVLGLAPPVALRDLAATLEPAHVGSVVHAVLAAIVTREKGRWPAEPALRELCLAEAREVARAEGLAPAGLARVLALRAQAFLEVARRLDAAGPAAARAEVRGTLALAGLPEVRFRADRVEGREPASAWIDFKTSRHPLSALKTEAARTAAVLQQVHSGRALQAAAYALAAGPEAVGRYVYLHPLVPETVRTLELRGGDAELGRHLRLALERLAAALAAGAFPPRLVAPDLQGEHPGCAYCDFQPACQRGDSGARARTAAYARALDSRPATAGFEAALQGLWLMTRRLPAPARKKGAS